MASWVQRWMVLRDKRDLIGPLMQLSIDRVCWLYSYRIVVFVPRNVLTSSSIIWSKTKLMGMHNHDLQPPVSSAPGQTQCV